MATIKLQGFYNFFVHRSKRERYIIYISIFFVSAVFLDRLIISPILSNLKSVDGEIQEKVAGIKKNLHILAQKEKISKEKLKYHSFLENLKFEEEKIANEIVGLANKNSVYIIEIKSSDTPLDIGSAKKYLITLSCEAQMEQLAEFMYNIENSDNLLRIEKYQISQKSNESSVARCVMSIAKITM